MAAFTTFSREALERYVSMFGIGELVHFEAITGGIENSNYFVTLASGDETFEFVLTITEDLDFAEVPFFNDLFMVLDRAGLPVPNPERTLDGMAGTIFCGKPAWLFPRLTGSHPDTANAERCRLIGATLAAIHRAGEGARYSRDNPYPSSWARRVFSEKRGLLPADTSTLLADAIDEYAGLESRDDLPAGIIHGDLFMDNTLFDDTAQNTLSGVIDFYHACHDFYVQDLAITLNAWAVNDDGSRNADLASPLIDGYESERTLTPSEKEALPAFIRAGAARFALTRLISGDEDGPLKDPNEYLKILEQAQA